METYVRPALSSLSSVTERTHLSAVVACSLRVYSLVTVTQRKPGPCTHCRKEFQGSGSSKGHLVRRDKRQNSVRWQGRQRRRGGRQRQ